MKTLILFSGGIDSTYILNKMLSTTADEITAFRVSFPAGYGNRKGWHWHEGALQSESIAAQSIADELQTTRPFTYVNVTVTDEQADTRLSRGHVAVEQGAAFALANGFDRVFLGREPHHILPDGGEKHWQSRLTLHNTVAPAIPLETPLLDWMEGTPHAYATLSQSLLSKVATCRQPTIVEGAVIRCDDFTVTGHCYQGCFNRNLVEGFLAAGATPDAILDTRLRKLGIGAYEGVIAPDPDYRKGK